MSSTPDPVAQHPYDLRFDWGAAAAARLAEAAGVLVIVDVLFFGTTVSVAVEAGSAVFPSPADDAAAGPIGADADAVLAVRPADATAARPWTLVPSSLRRVPPPPRLVLRSRNGSTIAAGASTASRCETVVACLRNARAVGEWAAARYGTSARPVAVVAAGERWPDGSLRPALEDLLCAGIIIDEIARRRSTRLSPEAAAARAVAAAADSIPDLVRACASGVEVAAAGLLPDLDIALEIDASDVVPVLRDGAFHAEQ